MLLLRTVALCLGVMFAGAPAHADVVFLTANITHSQETAGGPFLTSTGAPRPGSFGTAAFVLDTSLPFMTFVATIFNIDVTGTQTVDTFDNLVAAHIHAPAPMGPGVNASVRWGFFGAPDNDNSPSDLVVTPFATGVGGTFTSTWDAPEGNTVGGIPTNLTLQLSNILNELSYINFHTTQFGAGEIRGQILAVPEPASLALLGLGLVGLAALRRRSA